MIEDVFQTINCITQTEEKTKVYHEPNFKTVPQVSKERAHEVSFSKYNKPNSPVKVYSNSLWNTHYNSNFRSGNKQHSSQLCKEQGKQQYNHRQSKLECYFCKGDHLDSNCKKFSKDKTKYNMKTAHLAKKYKDKLRQAVRKDNITVNKATLSNTQEIDLLCGTDRTTSGEPTLHQQWIRLTRWVYYDLWLMRSVQRMQYYIKLGLIA